MGQKKKSHRKRAKDPRWGKSRSKELSALVGRKEWVIDTNLTADQIKALGLCLQLAVRAEACRCIFRHIHATKGADKDTNIPDNYYAIYSGIASVGETVKMLQKLHPNHISDELAEYCFDGMTASPRQKAEKTWQDAISQNKNEIYDAAFRLRNKFFSHSDSDTAEAFIKSMVDENLDDVVWEQKFHGRTRMHISYPLVRSLGSFVLASNKSENVSTRFDWLAKELLSTLVQQHDLLDALIIGIIHKNNITIREAGGQSRSVK